MSTNGTDRTSIIRGPGAIMLGSLVLHDSAGIQADVVVAANPVGTSLYGRIDSWLHSRQGEVSFTPGGELSAAIMAALFPYQNPNIGASIFGGADVPLLVHSKAGTKVVFTNAALVGCPTLHLSRTKVAFAGQAKFRCLLGKGCAPTDTNALLTPPAAVAFGSSIEDHWEKYGETETNNRLERIRQAFATVQTPQESWQRNGKRYYLRSFQDADGTFRRMMVVVDKDGNVVTWVPNEKRTDTQLSRQRKGALQSKEGAE